VVEQAAAFSAVVHLHLRLAPQAQVPKPPFIEMIFYRSIPQACYREPPAQTALYLYPIQRIFMLNAPLYHHDKELFACLVANKNLFQVQG